MARYRVYSLDGIDKIDFADDIEADNDQAAIAAIQEMKPNFLKCEIWEGRRLVATLKGAERPPDSVLVPGRGPSALPSHFD